MTKPQKIDEIGRWSEIKLEIVRDYASAYTMIVGAPNRSFEYWYIDAFAGRGIHKTKKTGELVTGSPLNALRLQKPFQKYWFIDLDKNKASALRQKIDASFENLKDRVEVLSEDCNQVLLGEILPQVKYSEYKRALMLLDPYGLHLDWQVIQLAGQLKTVEIFLNFPIMDMNMNVLLSNPNAIDSDQAARMTRFWGDNSWKQVVFIDSPDLFSDDRLAKIASHKELTKAFKARLKKVAGFAYVADPIAMKNSINSDLYYLFYASPNRTGHEIVTDILKKYRK